MGLYLSYPPTAPASMAMMHPHIDFTRAPARTNNDASVTPQRKQITLICSERMTHVHSG